MPGRTPADAFRAFIDPIQAAVSCLGNIKITTSPGGRTAPGKDHAWALNDLAGVSPGPGLLFDATMGYRIIPDEREGYGPWRVTTLEYRYKFSITGHDAFRVHWHPRGHSHVTYPHLHLALDAGALRSPEALKRHLPTGRITLEQAIAWAVELGAPPRREDWEDVLRSSEGPHLRHRSWGLFGGDAPAAVQG